MDLRFRSFGRRTGANKNPSRGDASAKRAVKKICSADGNISNTCAFDRTSVTSCNHATRRDGRHLKPGCVGFATNSSVAHRRTNDEPVAVAIAIAIASSVADRSASYRSQSDAGGYSHPKNSALAIASSVADRSAGYRGQSDAGGYSHPKNSALAIDSGSSQPDRRAPNNADDSASNGPTGLDAGADARS